jgi:hypothetical protein
MQTENLEERVALHSIEVYVSFLNKIGVITIPTGIPENFQQSTMHFQDSLL